MIDSPFPESLKDILLALAGRLDVSSEELASQARLACVKAWTSTYIEVGFPSQAPTGLWPDGPLRLSPTVIDDRGIAIGSILVWVACGRISLVKQSWYTDEPPTDWPPLDRVQFK